jgi:hypothetical protein
MLAPYTEDNVSRPMTYNRRHLLSATLSATLWGLADLAAAGSKKPGNRMPSIFVGHGSPMNALESNAFTRTLQKWGKDIGRPSAILVVSTPARNWPRRHRITIGPCSTPWALRVRVKHPGLCLRVFNLAP